MMVAVISIMFADSHGVTFRTVDYWSKTHTHHLSGNTIILLQRTIIDYFYNNNVPAMYLAA